MLESLLQDVRYGTRVLLKNPSFTAVAVITLALGIGANSAIFSIIYGVLLRPLPYRNGAQMAVVHQRAPLAQINDLNFSPLEVADYRAQNHTMSAVVEHHSMSFILYGREVPERLQTGVVNYNFFDILGVTPILGRTFAAEDEKPDAPAVLILTNNYWKQSHNGDPNIIGKSFQMNNRPHTVIGVLPDFPQYPSVADIYITINQCPFRSAPAAVATRNSFRILTLFGLLKPGVQPEQAQADFANIANQFQQNYPETYPQSLGLAASVVPLHEDLTLQARPTFLILLATAGFVLLIACANVANLTLARLMRRDREMAVRAALGASRLRIVRQLLIESVLLSVAGGAIGLFIASWGLPLLASFASRFTNRAGEIRLDSSMLLFTFGLSVLTGIAFGLMPALSSRLDLVRTLKEGGRGASAGHGGARSALVVIQVAISFVLLIGAGLMFRSLLKLQEVRPGFNSEKVLALRLTPSFTKYNTPPLRISLFDGVLEKIKTLPGVVSVALGTTYPLNPIGITAGPGNANFTIEGKPVAPDQLAPQVDVQTASPDYFQTIGTPLLQGRMFTDADINTSPPVAVINQSLARHRWGNEDPIGRRISFNNGTNWITIVGIVGDAKVYGLNQNVPDQLYVPVKQSGGAAYLLVKTAADPMSISKAVRDGVTSVTTDTAIDQVRSLEEARNESVASPRLTALLLGLFSVVALLITSAGIVGVMTLSVTQRTQEIGIRMALGASQARVLRMVMWQGMSVVLIGLGIGIGAALALSRVISRFLFAVPPTDWVTFLAVSSLLLLVAAGACLMPARRVTRIDPMIALRQE